LLPILISYLLLVLISYLLLIRISDFISIYYFAIHTIKSFYFILLWL